MEGSSYCKALPEPESLATHAVNSTDSADSARCKLHTGTADGEIIRIDSAGARRNLR
jgi:hypothetical protein